MKLRMMMVAALAALVALAGMAAPAAAQEQFIPLLVYRTGPYAPSGIPTANGMTDYLRLLNARDGGINGVKITWEECETQYNTKLGVECYEKLKDDGPTGASLVNPYSTGITYQLIPKARVDEVPLHSMAYGRTAAADGRVFPWTFNFPATYWDGASVAIKYIADEEGGDANLKGKTIALVYHNSAYGKEPIPTLEALAKRYGYKLELLAVDHPGQEQRATWLQVRRMRPAWVLMWGWGVMNQVAVKEAANINYPMDHFIGIWWSGSEQDVVPAGDGAKGYKSLTFHAPAADFDVHKAVLKYVYNGDMEKAKANNYGEVLYNRGLVNAMYDTESIRTAMRKYGNKPMTGEQVRWGLENLDLSEDDVAKLGFGGVVPPIKITCDNHRGSGKAFVQQWDGQKWHKVSDWYTPHEDLVRAQVEKAAMDYAKENNITPRDCN